MINWIANNIVFISWHKQWKGVYIHCLSRKYCYRIFLWEIDKHLKGKYMLQNMNGEY